MIKAVAFDLDNTLIDFHKFKKETARAAAKAMVKAGLKAKPSAVARQIFEVYDKCGIEYQKTFSTLLWSKYKVRHPNTFEKIQQAGITAYLQKKFTVLKPYKDVRPTLKKLRKRRLKLCIVTDAPRNKAWQRLTITGLQDEFDFVVTFDDTKKLKPSEHPFKVLLKKIKLKPGEVLFVGDNPERDVKGAKKLGMKTALAAYGWHMSKKSRVKPDYTLRRFADVLGI